MAKWSIYLLRDECGHLYTGITTDVSRRFKEHSLKTARGAKYTRAKAELSLVYHCALGSRSTASRAEYRIKRLSKEKKESIVCRNHDAESLCLMLGIT